MNARKAVLAAAVCLALLSGCGGGGSGEPAPLTARQAESVLPDTVSVPGWDTTIEPVAHPLKTAKERGLARCYAAGTRDSCARVRFFGASGLHRQKAPNLYFTVQTYRDEAAARSAFATVWTAWEQRVPEPKAMSAGKLGDQRRAVAGLSSSAVEGSRGLMILVREGSVLMLSVAESGLYVEMADSFLTPFADAFAKRAVQAEAGGRPSAGVKASAS
ncbi:hypothetical protein [Streptomyces naphthomycinicus]|uniref:hypothetical protein n=1 Tax=Streptomyces naphthomycinicus TaxID=2872625 RepID=UPI001CEDDC81|nr:hypothetical protein [Streptomyces sp. TML10]